MGRGTISGGGTDGLYTLQLDYGKGVRDARIVVIDLKIERLNIEIAEALDAIVLAEARTQELAGILHATINDLITAQVNGEKDLIKALLSRCDVLTTLYARASSEEAALRVPRDLKIAERKQMVATKGELQAALIEETQQVWCVDYTESAAGEVATIEIPGEDRAVLIAPGARAPVPADGALRAREIMSPEQAFWNAAVLPGWQKWKPTYRKATITSLNKSLDTASVDLDPETSSAAGLGINQALVLTGVPVLYMTCNAEVFEVGSRVVVEFVGMSWESPMVIGFVDNPKSCEKHVVEYRARFQPLGPEQRSALPAPGISGVALQLVAHGEDATPVTAEEPGLAFKWISWSDGLGSKARHETNIRSGATYFADYLVADPVVIGQVVISQRFTEGGLPNGFRIELYILPGAGYTRASAPPPPRLIPHAGTIMPEDTDFSDYSPVLSAGGYLISYTFDSFGGFRSHSFRIASW